MFKEVDGMLMNMENEDGIDIRNGCHDIVISNITGQTGDDVVALTAIVVKDEPYMPGGSLRTTHVMHNDWSIREPNIHDIIIRNVVAHSFHCYMIRLLPANTQIYNVIIDNVIDTGSATEKESHGTMILGDGGNYGENLRDSMRNVCISNVIGGSNTEQSYEGATIDLQGYLVDSVITNVINKNAAQPAMRVRREDGMINVTTSNLITVRKRNG